MSKRVHDYSEAEMCDSLERVIRETSYLPSAGRVSGIFREVSCQQGTPDFLLLHQPESQSELCGSVVGGLAAAEVLSLCSRPSGMRIETLREKSRHKPATVNRALANLRERGLVALSPSGAYRTVSVCATNRTEIWALEAKLNNARRALFQAQQAKLYADRVIIVVPPDQIGKYTKWWETMSRWGIGLLSFDIHDGEIRVARRSRRSSAISKAHQFYAMGKLARMSSAAEVSRVSV